jgi:hypothetical protein
MRDQMEITAAIHQEDIGACDAVWTGLKSRFARSGALCAQEGAIRHFARWRIEEMTEGS